MDHLFNSLDSAYKTPRGAVRAGEPLRLALTIPEHYGFVEPRLVLTKDGGDPVEYRMDFKGCVEGVNHFRLSLTLDGYRPCHNAAEVIEAAGYEPEHDLDNPADSVFCSHGAGFVVPWEQVRSHMPVSYTHLTLPTTPYV